MGCLVDTFIIASKHKWMEAVDHPTEKSLKEMLSAVPEKYRIMLRSLIVKFKNLNRIMDNRNSHIAWQVMKAAEPYEGDTVSFTSRYRDECLQQVLRVTFYDTLLIVENDYNEEKYNYFVVLNSNNVISANKWKMCPSDDQTFVRQVIGMFNPSAFEASTLRQ